jgi:hypothetical protein
MFRSSEFLENQFLKIGEPLNRLIFYFGFKKLEAQFLKNLRPFN